MPATQLLQCVEHTVTTALADAMEEVSPEMSVEDRWNRAVQMFKEAAPEDIWAMWEDIRR